MRLAFCALTTIVCLASMPLMAAESWPPAIEPLFRSVDLNVGESCDVQLSDGTSATLKLLDLKETRDDRQQAVREARVTVELNGQKATLTGYNYQLPVVVGGVQIDCAITRGCLQPGTNPWALEKDARLRLWPADSPWIQPGTFLYPVHQRWFANMTQMANEPTYVSSVEKAGIPIYYHHGMDIGGSEEQVDVVAATDAVVAVAGVARLDNDFPRLVRPRPNVVYLRDGRGWYYCYSHLFSIDPAVKPGAQIKMGQKIGVLGKTGTSGGWSHLHFDIFAPQPSGRFGVLDGYAFIWQAYHAQHKTQLQAVAQPHRVAWTGEDVVLDGRLSWSAKGPQHIASYQWTLSDGQKADGSTVTRRYSHSGEYSEMLKVTDADGRVDYDFTVVQIVDREHPKLLPSTIHAVYWPTLDLKVGDEVTFKVRSFGPALTDGCERWDFGDGSPPVDVHSVPATPGADGARAPTHAKDGYAVTTHRYAKPGDYLVSVSRTNDRGQTATARLCVRIEPSLQSSSR